MSLQCSNLGSQLEATVSDGQVQNPLELVLTKMKFLGKPPCISTLSKMRMLRDEKKLVRVDEAA